MTKRILGGLFVGFIAVCATGQTTAPATEPAEKKIKPKVLQFQIYDPIEDRLQADRLIERVGEVMKKQDRTIFISIDTPGGDPELVSKMLTFLRGYKGKKVAYIDNARYGGCFGFPCALVWACDLVIMHPSASIGTKVKGDPLPISACQGIPCSPIHEKTMEAWRRGEFLTGDTQATPAKYLDTFLILPPDRQTGLETLKKIFMLKAMKVTGYQAKIFDPYEPAGGKNQDPQPITLTAKECLDLKLCDTISAHPVDTLVKVAGDEEFVLAKCPLNSRLNTLIPAIYSNAKGLGGSDYVDYRGGDSLSAQLSNLQRKRAYAGSIRNVLRVNPSLQVWLYADLKSMLHNVPGGNAPSDMQDGWCEAYIEGVMTSLDYKISDLKSRIREEARRKAEEARAKREAKRRDAQSRSNNNTHNNNRRGTTFRF